MTNGAQSRCLMILMFSLWLIVAATSMPAQDGTGQAGAPGGRYRVAGTVMNLIGAHPLPGTRVALTNARTRQDTQTMVTADDGRFEFWVKAGKYSLEAAKRGFIHTFYMQHQQFSTAIVTGAGLNTEDLVLRVAPTAAIIGRVFDEFGEPVRQASVSVYREDRQSGISQIRERGESTTDDLGTYEVGPLDDGTYFVAVRAKPWYAVHPASADEGTAAPKPQVDSSLDVAYPVTFYADATESDDATPIPVRGGDRVEIDFHLGAVPALHLILHTAAEGKQGYSLPVLQSPAFDGMSQVQPDGIQMISPGVFAINGLPPGRYSVQFMDRETRTLREPTDVDLTSNSQDLDATVGNPSSTITAKVALQSGDKVPETLAVALRNAKGRFVSVSQVDKEGEAVLHNVLPGTYFVAAASSEKDYAVNVTTEGGQHTGHTLEVASGSSPSVSFSLVGGEVRVDGFAKRGGKAASGAMIVLVPKAPEENPESFRRDQSDQDGSFSLLNVVPGSYTILAIEDGWDLDWGVPAVIARYAEHGQSILVTEETKREMQIAEPVEIQPK